jgi:ubiquinone/menaquinone biosynthesis C-methylase UbiE
MPINFHSQENRYIYAGREADKSWRHAITTIVDPVGKRVADVGCGGGIYTRAWSELGARQVIGIDFSAQMVQAATESTAGLPNITIRQGVASTTGLADACVDVVFERAIIHHLADLTACFQEAKRILPPDGIYIIQDRTLEDVQIPGSVQHLRGYFFECFPKLLAVEKQRRPSQHWVVIALQKVGFVSVQTQSLWETRRVYANHDELANDLRARDVPFCMS